MGSKKGVQITVNMRRSRPWEDALSAYIKSQAHMLAYQHARRVQKYAKENVPQPPGASPSGYVRTGKLKASIHRVRVAPGHHRIEVDAKNDDGKDYGPFVEFGTRHMRAQPFLGPAVKADRAEFRVDVKNMLKDWRP